MYVASDSVEVWENQDIFSLDDQKYPQYVGGVPPDYYSPTGQKWENPVYDWKSLADNDFDFLIKRFTHANRLYDVIRIDHFRGYDTYWAIDAQSQDATTGQWHYAHAKDFFTNLCSLNQHFKLIAEDLGEIRKEVLVLENEFGIVGMDVFQFSFKAKDIIVKDNIVLYPGTHDNQTLKGWINDLSKTKLIAYQDFFKQKSKQQTMNFKIIDYLFRSKAQLVIIPIQDFLELGDDARINIPGEINTNNWKWQLKNFDQFKLKEQAISDLLKQNNRKE